MLAAVSCANRPPPAGERLGSAESKVINGSPADPFGEYLAVGHMVYNGIAGSCSAFLVARRVALTAGHCVAANVVGCANAPSLGIQFARADGTFGPTAATAAADAASRTVAVKAFRINPAAVLTVGQCPNVITPSVCSAPQNQTNPQSFDDRSQEVTVLYLASDPPSDVRNTPLPLMVDPGWLDAKSAATLVAFAGLEKWASATTPKVTFVGYGAGSHAYGPNNTAPIGRDFGIMTWARTSSPVCNNCLSYGGAARQINAQACTASTTSTPLPAIVVSPSDIPAPAPGAGCAPVPNGASYPPSNESHDGCGDSGGPVLVVPDQNNVQRPTTDYSPLYRPSTSAFLQQSLHDSDGDTVPDIFDICPLGDDLADTDGDGIPDACDPCPCDIPNPLSCAFVPKSLGCVKGIALYDNDQDGDGYCKDDCPPFGAGDNCPYVANEQGNTNTLAEDAHKAEKRGDRCDASIAASTAFLWQSQTSFKMPIPNIPPNVAWTNCTTYDQPAFQFKPLASGAANLPGGKSSQVGFSPTGMRFCQHVPNAFPTPITCTNPDLDIQDPLFEGPGNQSADQEKIGGRWHRMSLSVGNMALPLGSNFFLPYFYGEADPFLPDTYAWDYKSDFARWTGAGPGNWLVGQNINSPSDLAGSVWTHTVTSVGDTIDVGSGLHGAQLNNFHAKQPGGTDYQPTSTQCPTCGFAKPLFGPDPPNAPPPSFSYLVVRPAPQPLAGNFAPSALNLIPNAAAVVAPLAGGQVGVLGAGCGNGGAQIVTNVIGPALLSVLTSGAPIVNAAEPGVAMGAQSSFPLAISLSPSGDQITAMISATGATLSTAADAPACTAPPTPPGAAFVRTFGTLGSGPGQFDFPVGVGVDAGGNAYVVDRSNQRVCKFGSDGTFLLCWGGAGSGDGQFGAQLINGGPAGIAAGPTGRSCVADTDNSRVECFDANGNFVLKFGSRGSDPGQFAAEFGLGFDPSTGDIYVADTFNHRIEVFDAAGAYMRQWGSFGSGPGQLAYPRDAAIDGQGNVYVADYDNSRIAKFDRQGNFLLQWGTRGSAPGQLDHAQGVAVDAAGLVYVADWLNNRVQIFSPTGQLVALWGSAGSGNGQFSGPIKIAVGGRGQIFVTDYYNQRLNVPENPPKIDGVAEGNRELLIQPVVDYSGYTLVLRQDQGNDKVKVERTPSLAFQPATLADLGKQL